MCRDHARHAFSKFSTKLNKNTFYIGVMALFRPKVLVFGAIEDRERFLDSQMKSIVQRSTPTRSFPGA